MTSMDPQAIYQSAEYQQELGAQRTFMARVFGWMTIGLLVTALVSLAISSVPALQQEIAGNRGLFWTLLLVQLGIAIAFGFVLNKIPAPVAAALFITYSALTGAVFSVLFLVYTLGSIAGTFFVTAGMFGAMAVIGYTTKKDLTKFGGILLMALIGLILAMVVNFFMQSSVLGWLVSFAGVIIFTGLTAYDSQKIKQAYASGEYGSTTYNRTAIFGAFILYLDFINLFLYLLRFMGSRRN
jgi:FtsH-binding integral membrane protein